MTLATVLTTIILERTTKQNNNIDQKKFFCLSLYVGHTVFSIL